MTDAAAVPPRHYPTPAAKCADLVVHLTGLVLALFGGGLMLGLAVAAGGAGKIAAAGVFAAGLLAMLAFSTAYNFGKAPWRPLLRRLDHAGIFLMIAASYTPFTTQVLQGAWAWGMTAAVWTIALLGVAGKLLLPGLGRKVWIGVYLAFSWLVVVALQPMAAALSLAGLILLAVGGLAYTTGVVFYVQKRFKYARAVWHGHVIAGAGAHWAAVLVGVVLTSPGA
jgi:hemolysin III